ncbi:MAG: hypothetical protein P1V20_20085, partial [Verrucomicrobiales bacterium]|nr:hypothetical protein [Verrucomicrobiales bacterium]
MTSKNTTGISQNTGAQPTLDQLAGREPMPEPQIAAEVNQAEQQVEAEPSIELKAPLNPMIYREGKNLILIDGAAI